MRKKLILISPEKLHHYQKIYNLDYDMKHILDIRSIYVEDKFILYRKVLQ